MHWHWQNLNEGGWAIRHGRAWLHFTHRACWQVEWGVWPKWKRFSLQFVRGGEENDYAISVAAWLFSLYVNISGLRSYNALPRGWGRTTGIAYSEDHLTLQWNCDDSSWSSRDGPAHGWYKSWFVRDVLFGRAEYSSDPQPPIAATVVMPEGSYPCSVVMHLDTWTRPRIVPPKRIHRATVDIPGGIPVPGKGENSWDCGDDATYSLTCPAWTVDEALEAVRASALKTRERYGGRNWRPKPPHSLGQHL